MARLPFIPDNLLEPLLLKSAEGMSNGELANWLATEHGIQVKDDAVARRLKKIKLEHQAAAQAAYSKAAAKSAINELKIIDGIIESFNKEIMVALKEGDRAGAKGLSDSLHKYIMTHVAMATASSTETENLSEDETLSLILNNIKPPKSNAN